MREVRTSGEVYRRGCVTDRSHSVLRSAEGAERILRFRPFCLHVKCLLLTTRVFGSPLAAATLAVQRDGTTVSPVWEEE